MKDKIASFFKKELFEFNSAFLSAKLEERLKYRKVLSELFLNLRKRIVFYLLSFALFCAFVTIAPKILQIILQLFVNDQNKWRPLGLVCISVGLSFVILYSMQLMKSLLFRDLDFFIVRVQVTMRYLSKPYTHLQYENLKSGHLFQFFLSVLSIIPLIILYYSLSEFLSVWIALPIFLHLLTFCAVWLLCDKNAHYLEKTKDHYQKDVKFFLSIGKFLKQIRTLAFDSIIKKQILSFSDNNSFLYQKIFENNIVISGIKYCVVFLVFSLNSILFFSLTSTPSIVQFISVLLISFIQSYCFLSILKIFDVLDGTKEILHLFKAMDLLNAKEKIKEYQDNDEANQNIISFENASFVKNNQVVFHQLSQQLKKNTMISVIGSTQEERSYYLSACVGHLQQIGGKVYHPENFEFLPKKTILFEGSIRENIIGSQEFNQQYYQEILDACALKNDLDCLPLNDLTKISLNQVNLSPSFLKKIGIARVIYAKSAVNFFDDPFCDLSQQDASKIFFNAFQKLLAGTTRIFSTDRPEYAALSDDIVFCRGGKIIEQGSHISLLAQNGVYARSFYSGVESKRLDVLQNYAKQNYPETQAPISPLLKMDLLKVSESSSIWWEQIFNSFKTRINNLSYALKMFFPVFASKNFYAFFTFLTLSIWASVYSFYFIFENLTLHAIAKLSVLFMCFSIIASVSFSVMLLFYKNVYTTCTYIIENVSRFYFARFLTHDTDFHFDWRKEHILLTTGKFYNQLLNFFIISFFCLTFAIFLTTISVKFFVASVLGLILIALCAHTFIQTKLFYDDENSKQMNKEFYLATAQFFESYHEPQSKRMHDLLLEKVQAKLYGMYFLDSSISQKKFSFFKIIHINSLWQNYCIIEDMISATSMEQNVFKPRNLSSNWPEHGLIQVQNVKFNSESDLSIHLTIPVNARFMYVPKIDTKTSIFIEKLRLLSPIVSGEIKIDGEDISLVSQSDIRRYIGYISQSSYIPFLSIRQHLDPYQEHDDIDIWEVLNCVALSQHVALLKYGLSTKIEHVPQKMFWSGEVLLFSLARCILNKNKIICIDCIDVSEDIANKICQLIQSECEESTIVFADLNEKFKSICTMIYSECEENNIEYSDANNILPSNNEENELHASI